MSDEASASQSGRLAGQVAIVTGAASGIGGAVADRFVAEGASVIGVDRVERNAGVSTNNPMVIGDAVEPEVMRTAVELAKREFGKLDVLICNVGVFDYFHAFERYDLSQIDCLVAEMMSANLATSLVAARACLPDLRSSRGSMVFTASAAGLHARCGGVLYTASKHAVVGAVRQLAAELAPEVRVNAVAPGGTRTGLAGAPSLGQGGRRLDEWAPLEPAMKESTPMARTADPNDHASLYVLLASRKESSMVTGSVFSSDGGVGVR